MAGYFIISLYFSHAGQVDQITFPDELHDYGLNERLLVKVFNHVQTQKNGSLSWCLRGVPNVGFYQQLHRFMKKWPLSHSSTKVAIGRFYIAIDKNLQAKGYRPDNAYRFIERTVRSNQLPTVLMNYGLEDNQVKTMQTEVKECSECIQKLMVDFGAMKIDFDGTKKQLGYVSQALKDVTNDMKIVKGKQEIAQRKAVKLQKVSESALSDCLALEENLCKLEVENSELSQALSFVQKQRELSTFSFETKSDGKMYSPAIRTLYYTFILSWQTKFLLPKLVILLKQFSKKFLLIWTLINWNYPRSDVQAICGLKK